MKQSERKSFINLQPMEQTQPPDNYMRLTMANHIASDFSSASYHGISTIRQDFVRNDFNTSRPKSSNKKVPIQ